MVCDALFTKMLLLTELGNGVLLPVLQDIGNSAG